MSKYWNDQIKTLWHAIVTWSRQHYWPWGTQLFDRRRVLLSEHVSPAMLKRRSLGTLFVFVMMTLFGRIWIDYSDHYLAPKQIRIEYSVHPYILQAKCPIRSIRVLRLGVNKQLYFVNVKERLNISSFDRQKSAASTANILYIKRHFECWLGSICSTLKLPPSQHSKWHGKGQHSS